MNCKDTNYELIEKFGSLEKICNQIYGEKHGVTAYIDDMAKNNDFGEVYVRDWSDFLQGLKEVRHKRNQLSHGDVPFSSDYAQKDDLKFIDDFHELILTQNDPLTILRKEHERHLKEAGCVFFPFPCHAKQRPENHQKCTGQKQIKQKKNR